MRAITLYVATAGCIVWLVVSLGGIGAAIYLGNVLNPGPGVETGGAIFAGQALMLALLIVCWAGPVTVALSFRSFFSAASSMDERAPRHIGEHFIVTALVLVALAVVNVIAPNPLGFDLVYGFALAAAVAANIGLTWVCLSIRKAR
jgi:hypothetical protein